MQPADELSKRSRAEGQHLLAPRAAHECKQKSETTPDLLRLRNFAAHTEEDASEETGAFTFPNDFHRLSDDRR